MGLSYANESFKKNKCMDLLCNKAISLVIVFLLDTFYYMQESVFITVSVICCFVIAGVT